MGEHRATWQLAPPTFPQVPLAGVGLVLLATLDELRDARETEQANADHLAWQAEDLDRQAEDRLADAGALLVPRRAWWRVPAELSPWLVDAERLVARVLLLDQRLEGLQRTARPEGPRATARIRRWVSERAAKDRIRAAERLREALVRIAQLGGEAAAAVPDVEPLLDQATELQARAEGLRTALAAAVDRLSALDREIARRAQADQRMGFDALYLSAYFQMHGLPATRSPVRLEADEVAYLTTQAALAPMASGTRSTASGSKDGISIVHTGIPNWIGGVQNRAAPVEAFRPVDAGNLVVSSRRLAFIGNAESVAIWLDAVVDVDIYTDAIAVSQLGREQPEIFLVTAPLHVAFYLNWAMSAGIVC